MARKTSGIAQFSTLYIHKAQGCFFWKSTSKGEKLFPEYLTAILIRQMCNYWFSMRRTHLGIWFEIHNRNCGFQRRMPSFLSILFALGDLAWQVVMAVSAPGLFIWSPCPMMTTICYIGLPLFCYLWGGILGLVSDKNDRKPGRNSVRHDTWTRQSYVE